MQQLKSEIVRRLEDITEVKSLSTLKDSGKRLTEIWDAIKKENFVFSFKNVLAIETHQQLTNVFNIRQWEVKSMTREQIRKQKITIKKSIREHNDLTTVNREIDKLTDGAKRDAKAEIETSVHAVREDIKHYFTCNGQGCTMKTPCSKDVKNRHLIADNEKEFMDDIKQLEITLNEESNASLSDLKTALKANVQINKMNADMDARLKKKVKDVVRKVKAKIMTEAEIEQIFNRLWTDETEDIMKDVEREDKDVNIKITTENLVLKRLGKNSHNYREKKNTGFLVRESHMKKKGWSPLTSLNKDDMDRLRQASKKIIAEAAIYYRQLEAGREFQISDAKELIQRVLSMIRRIKDGTFETTVKYKVDLLVHIKKLAVDSFSWHSRKSTNQTIDRTACSLLPQDERLTYEERLGFVVHSNHVKARYFKSGGKSLLQEKSKNIIESTEHYYTLPTEGKKFLETDADELFEEIYSQTCKISEATVDYQVDLMMYIENLAIKGFTELHKMYRDQSSPRALLEEKKKGYKASFMSLMKQGDSATAFCHSVLRHAIVLTVDDRLSPDALFTEVRKHGGDIFRDLGGLQAAIMVDLYKENNFDKYLEYIVCYEKVVKEKLNVKSIECLTEKDRLKKLANEKLGKIIDEIEEAVKTTAEGPCDDADFISTLFKNLPELSLPSTSASADLLEVQDKRHFGAIVIEKLTGPIKEQIEEKINKWDVKKKLKEREWEEFIFAEVVGCTKRCPFCRVPCDIHTGGKKSGNHSATLHRPKGLGGGAVRTELEGERGPLSVNDCRARVASDRYFWHHNSDGSEERLPYKEYTKVYPEWTIRGDPEPDAEIYWKWVLARYNEEFADYYNAKEADIPLEWFQYNRNDIKTDIEDHYNATVDL